METQGHDLMVEDFLAFAETYLKGNIKITRQKAGVTISIFMPFAEQVAKVVKPKDPPTNNGLLAADGLYRAIKHANPEIKIEKTVTWAYDMDRLLKDYDMQFIGKVVKYVYYNDDNTFWRDKILSAASLRRKFKTVAAQANSATKPKPGRYM